MMKMFKVEMIMLVGVDGDMFDEDDKDKELAVEGMIETALRSYGYGLKIAPIETRAKEIED